MTDANIIVGIEGNIDGGKRVQGTLNDIADSGDKATGSQRKFEDQTKRTSRASSELSKALRGVVAAYGLRELQRTVDAYTNIQNRLRLVTSDTEELSAVTEELFRISNETRSSYEATAEVFARTAQATRDLGLSQRETLDFTQSLNQAVILSGASAQEAQAGLIQLSQGLASGALRGDELRSVLEQLPAVADIIADSLGVTRGQLRDLGADGAITAEIVTTAFAEAREELDERFSTTVSTVGQAFAVLQNNALDVIGSFDQLTGASGGLATALIAVADNLTDIAFAIGVATSAWALYKTAALAATGAAIISGIANTVIVGTQLVGVLGVLTTAAAGFQAVLLGPIGIAAGLAAVGVSAFVFRDELTVAFELARTTLENTVDAMLTKLRQLGLELRGVFGNENADALIEAERGFLELRTQRRNSRVDNAAQEIIDVDQNRPDLSSGGNSNGTSAAEQARAQAEATSSALSIQESLRDVINETRTEQERLTAEITELERLKTFATTAEEIEAVDRAIASATESLVEAENEAGGFESGLDRLINQTDDFAQSASDAFTSFIDGSRSAREALGDLLGSLQQLIIQETITNPFSDFIRSTIGGSNSAGGGFLSSVVGSLGSAAAGLFGFNAGGSMVIGGNGGIDNNTLSLNNVPIANVSRGETLNISPNSNGGSGGGITINQNLNIQTGVQETVAAEFESLLPRIQDATKAAIQEEQLRGIN